MKIENFDVDAKIKLKIFFDIIMNIIKHHINIQLDV